MTSSSLRRALLAVVLAIVALGVVAPAARADGDPGSDVLVYQNLFVAADSNISVPQQVELGNLLTAAGSRGWWPWRSWRMPSPARRVARQQVARR